ncbi:MAG: MBL fold metallo-hydrolase, partial [Desulfobacterales bacterium]
MKFKITTLVENTVGIGGSRKLIAEHGLAFLIETGTQRILFDTGQYLALENNARILGIDLATVDKVVLSHGHYDHSGGLKHLLACNSDFSLYAHPDVFARKMIERDNQYREIGMPVGKEVLVQKGVKLYLDTASLPITPHILTSGEIPLESKFESV